MYLSKTKPKPKTFFMNWGGGGGGQGIVIGHEMDAQTSLNTNIHKLSNDLA